MKLLTNMYCDDNNRLLGEGKIDHTQMPFNETTEKLHRILLNLYGVNEELPEEVDISDYEIDNEDKSN